MPSVNIGWRFTNYSDVTSAHICRATSLNSERAFEDALNGLSAQPSDFQVLSNIPTSGLTNDTVYTYTDTSASDNTTYYYCVAVKGSGTSLYKVGLSTQASTTAVTTSSTLGSSSVAAVAVGTGGSGGSGGSGSTTASIWKHVSTTYRDLGDTQIGAGSFLSAGFTQAELDNMHEAYYQAWAYWNTWLDLPDNGLPIDSYLYIDYEAQSNLTLAYAVTYRDYMYKPSDTTTSPRVGRALSELTFGDALHSMGAISINATAYKADPTGLYEILRHEVLHLLGLNWYHFFGINNPYMHSYVEDGITKYYYTGPNGFEKYKALVGKRMPHYLDGLVGIPVEDIVQEGDTTAQNAHFEEGNMVAGESYNNRRIYGEPHPALDNEISTPLSETPKSNMPVSSITMGFLEDAGWIVNYEGAELYDIPTFEY